MDLIRELLLKLEAISSAHRISLIGGSDAALTVAGPTPEEIDYHLALIKEAGLIESPGKGTLSGQIPYRRLTWTGHDFLDSVRDQKIWRETKDGAEKVGGFSIEMLSALAKGLIKKKIEQHTGVKLDF